jgi:hypothetical protein
MQVDAMGCSDRFRDDGAQFQSYLGPIPKGVGILTERPHGDDDARSGNRGSRPQLQGSGATASQRELQLAAHEYDLRINEGAARLETLCVVAARLAGRAWSDIHR